MGSPRVGELSEPEDRLGDLGAGDDRGRAEHSSVSGRSQTASRESVLAEPCAKTRRARPRHELSKGGSAEVARTILGEAYCKLICFNGAAGPERRASERTPGAHPRRA